MPNWDHFVFPPSVRLSMCHTMLLLVPHAFCGTLANLKHISEVLMAILVKKKFLMIPYNNIDLT